MDHDTAATANARSKHEVRAEGTCGACSKPMYREAVYPGVVNEWRHKSSGHQVSWTPEKHDASPSGVAHHNHRFPPHKGAKAVECAYLDCDATIEPPRPYEAPVALTGSAAREAASRKRGVERSKRRIGSGTGY